MCLRQWAVKNDVAAYFKRAFEESGVLDKVVMFLNLSGDPVVERIITPRAALTVAEYLAFTHGMHILVISNRYDLIRRGVARDFLVEGRNPE